VIDRKPYAGLRSAVVVAAALGALVAAPPARPQVPPPASSEGAKVNAVVDGVPIRQLERDRLAPPYFREIEAEAGRPLTEDETRLLRQNVLHELIRERLWIADGKRRGMSVTEAQIDARMKQSDFFKTDGKPDDAKFLAFKRSATSNYPTLRTQLELGLILEQYSDGWSDGSGPGTPRYARPFASEPPRRRSGTFSSGRTPCPSIPKRARRRSARTTPPVRRSSERRRRPGSNT
jgi:hypothetical protein